MTINTALADIPAAGAKALADYLNECRAHAIQPDIGGAFAYAFSAGAALTTAAAVPAEGWVMVPVEPTPEMVHAVRFAGAHDAPAIGAEIVAHETVYPFVGEVVATRMCRAMLAAAPKAEPVPAASEVEWAERMAALEEQSGGTFSAGVPAGDYPPLLDRDALIDIIAQGLHGTYHCNRVWEAWNYGTMGEGDFSPVDESDTPAEITDSILAHLAASPTAQAAPAAGAVPAGIYVASRASLPERPARWRALRTAGWPIVSTWIDEAGPGETDDAGELWARILREVASAQGVVLHVEPDDFPLKGALVEVGMALSLGKRVGVYAPGVALEGRSMRPLGSWAAHPLVRITPTLQGARDWIEAAPQPPAQAPALEAPASEWDVRGHLAATLTCWHRLTGHEAAELVALFRGRPAPQQAMPTESVLVDGIAYDTPAPVAAELLRLHIDAQQAAPTSEQAGAPTEHVLIKWDAAHDIAFQAAAAFRPPYFDGGGFIAHSWVVEAVRSAHIDGQRFARGLPAIDRSAAMASELRKERSTPTSGTAAAPVAEGDAAIALGLEIAKAAKEVECPRCGLRVISNCDSRHGCPMPDIYAAARAQAKEGGSNG